MTTVLAAVCSIPDEWHVIDEVRGPSRTVFAVLPTIRLRIATRRTPGKNEGRRQNPKLAIIAGVSPVGNP